MSLLLFTEQIPEQGLQLTGENSSDFLELTEGEFIATNAVEYDLHIQVMGDLLHIHGSAKTVLSALCGRCLEMFPLELYFEEQHLCVEIDLQAEQIDLRPALREELLLELPQFPRCENGTFVDGKPRICPKMGFFEQKETPSTVDPDSEATNLTEGNNNQWKALDGLTNLDNVADPSPEEGEN